MLICLLVVQELLICDISNSYYRQYSQPKPHTPSAKEKSKRKKPPKNPKQNKTNTHSHKEINVDNVFTKLLCLFKFQMNVAYISEHPGTKRSSHITLFATYFFYYGDCDFCPSIYRF
jgi:hypothetical protein